MLARVDKLHRAVFLLRVSIWDPRAQTGSSGLTCLIVLSYPGIIQPS